MKKFILTVVMVFFFTGRAMAVEISHWEFVGWEGGGCFPNIEVDPNIKDRVYLTSDVAGLWRSDDRGDHWRFATTGLKNLHVAAIAIAPSDSNVLYAATAGGVFVSYDAGEHWLSTQNEKNQIKFERPQSYRPIAISKKDSSNVCVATIKGEIFCSPDAGKKWQTLGEGQQQTLSVIAYDSFGTKIFVGGSSGFQIYDISKKTWSAIHPELKNLTDLLISKADPQRLYAAANGELWLSSDAGQSWQESSDKHEGKIFRLAIIEWKTIQIFAAANQDWNGKVLFSDDEGATWNSAGTSMTADRQADPTRGWANLGGKLTALKADPFDDKVIFRSDWWGIFRSDDGGKTWNEKIRGAPNTVASDIVMTKDALLVSSMDNGLLKSSDEGKSYQALFPSNQYDNAKAGHVWRVIAPSENQIVATSSPWNEKINQVIVSHDAGLNFKIVRQGLPQQRPTKNTMWGEGYPRALAFDPKDPNKIYLGIDGDDGGGLFISNDGGLTWKRSSDQPGSLRIYNALAVDPTDSKRIFWGACGKDGGVYVSSDGGKTWQHTLNQMSWVFDLAVSPSGIIYAAGDSSGAAVFVSHDHGATWEKLNTLAAKDAAEGFAIDAMDETRMAYSSVSWSASAPGRIFLGLDGGAIWQDITSDLPDGSGAAAMTFSPDGEYLYAARYAGSVYRLKISH